MQSVISTQIVISTRTGLVSTRRVRLPHAEYDFTRSVVATHTRVILTRMNMTLTTVISTGPREIYTRSVITTRTSVTYTRTSATYTRTSVTYTRTS
jgi:hypothetical protein